MNEPIERSIHMLGFRKTYASTGMQILYFSVMFYIKTILTNTHTASSWNLLTMEQLVISPVIKRTFSIVFETHTPHYVLHYVYRQCNIMYQYLLE
jgi:hypothetical protein